MNDEEVREFLVQFRVRSHAEGSAFVDRILDRPGWLRPFIAWGVCQKFQDPHMVSFLDIIRGENLLTPLDLAAIQVPTLLLWGQSERVLPASHLDFFRTHLPPQARIEEPDQWGHAPFLTHAEELSRRMLRFLAEVHSETAGAWRALLPAAG